MSTPRKRRGIFRPGELESPQTHVVASDLRRVGEVYRRAGRVELERWAVRLGLTLFALKFLQALVATPRGRARPNGVGVQLSVEATAKRYGVSPSTVKRGFRQLRERRLMRTVEPYRKVARITRARPLKHRISSFVDFDSKGTPRVHTWASCTAVHYATPRARTLLDAHDPKRHRHDRSSVWVALWNVLTTRCARFLPIAKRPSEDDPPCNCVSFSNPEEISNGRGRCGNCGGTGPPAGEGVASGDAFTVPSLDTGHPCRPTSSPHWAVNGGGLAHRSEAFTQWRVEFGPWRGVAERRAARRAGGR